MRTPTRSSFRSSRGRPRNAAFSSRAREAGSGPRRDNAEPPRCHLPLPSNSGDIREGEAWLQGAEIAIYDQGNRANHEPTRPRKLLLHRREIDRLYGQVREKGLTLVPTKLYFKDGRVKVELALARGKDVRDKRRAVADREAKRDMERALKARR